MEDHRATVCEIEIFEHQNADRLALAQPIGTDWVVIVGKNQFKTGDLAIYVPIDSIVPDSFVQKYLSNSKIKIEKNRIRSIKIRGVISQGLLVPVSEHHQLEADVTDELGIVKYEPPEREGSTKEKLPKKQKPFRKFVAEQFPKYTDISNHKNYKGALEEGQEVVILEKLHGTNARNSRVYVGGFKYPWYQKLWNKIIKKSKWQFTVGSHNVIKWYEDNVYWETAKRYGFDKLDEKWNGFAFYGEIYGGNTQELSYGIPVGKRKLAIFDIMHKNEWGQAAYLPWCEVKSICRQLNLETPPELYIGPWKEDLVKLADGKSMIEGAEHHREGFVVKPTSEVWHPRVGRLILKRISDTYLLGKKRTDYH